MPTVFISYSHDSPEHADRVLALSNRLRDDGLKTILDQYQYSPPEGWPRWMDHHVRTADFVLMLCTPTYLRRVHGEEQPGVGLGVRWESHLIAQHIYNAASRNERFIPLLFSDGDPASVPTALQGATIYHADQQDGHNGYQTLVRRMLGEQVAVPLVASGTRAPNFSQPWNVPLARNPFFTGREDALALLRETLAAGGGAVALTQPAAITGLGGIGKTQTAAEYAYRHRGEYTAVFWVTAATEETIAAGFSETARLLSLPEAAAQDQGVTTHAVLTWLRANSGWLCILDNADDLTLVQRMLPPALPGHVLITTRASALGGLAKPVRIDTLDAEQGATFLLRRIRFLSADQTLDASSVADRKAALALSEEIDGLPLALDQAGAYIRETPSTLSKYLVLFQKQRGALLAERGSLGDHASVTVTFRLALAVVERENLASAELLRLYAFLAPDAIPNSILTAGAAHLGPVLGAAAGDDLARDKATRGAHRWSLLDYDPKGDTFSIHRLVQAVIREDMTDAERRSWAERAVLVVNSAFPDIPEFPKWPLCDTLLPHAKAAAESLGEYGSEIAEAAGLLNKAGTYLYLRADYTIAPLLQSALAIFEKVLGPEHPNTAISLDNPAALYRTQGNYAAAPLQQHALGICEKVLGPEHLDTATSLNNLAEIYARQDDYATATPLFQRALAIFEKVLGPEHPNTKQVRANYQALQQLLG